MSKLVTKPRLGLIAALLLPFLGGCSSMLTVSDTRELTVPHEPGSALKVSGHNGSISVEQANVSEVQITARIDAAGYSRLREAEVMAERQGDGTLEIWLEWPDLHRKNNEAVAFDVQLPDTDGVELTTYNGRILLSGLGGDARLRTSNGRIVVDDHWGDLDARTTNGQIQATNVSGAIDASTTNGKLVLEQISGPVDIATTNGSITLIMNSDAVGPVEATTTNGSVTYHPADELSGELILSTTNGSLSFDSMPYAQLKAMSKNRVHLAFDDSDARSEIRTTNGSIKLR